MTEVVDVPASLDSLLSQISTKFDQAEAADVVHELNRLYPKASFDQNDLCGALKQLYELGAIDDDGDQKLLEILAGKTSMNKEIMELLSGGYKEACSPRKDDFVGRDVDVDDILKLVTDPRVPGVNLFGDSGVGKTTLAKEVSKRLESCDTLFIDLRDIKCVDTVYFHILQALHLPVLGGNNIVSIFKHLQTLDRKTALILDSIEQFLSRESQAEQETNCRADFLEFLKVIINTEASKRGHLKVILTSTTKLNESELKHKLFIEYNVQPFSKNVSKDFISKRVKVDVSDEQQDEAISEIADLCRDNSYLLQGAEQLMRENFASPVDVLRKITAQIKKGVPEQFACISALFDSLPNDHLKQVAVKISLLRRPFSVSTAMKIAEISADHDAELDLEMLAIHKIITAEDVAEKKPNESKRKYDHHALFRDFVTSHLCKQDPVYKEHLKKGEKRFFEYFSGKLTQLANSLDSEFVKTYSKLEINRANFELTIDLSEENKETFDLLLHTDDHHQFALMGILFEVLKDVKERRELFGKWADATEEQDQWFTSALMRCWQSIQGSDLEGKLNEEILEKAKTSIKKLQTTSPEKLNEVKSLFLHSQGKIKWMKARRLTPEQRTRKHGKKVLEEGIEHFKKSIEMRKQLNGDSTLTARALNLIGNCYLELEDPSEAKKHYQKAIDMRIRLVGNENHWEIPTYYNQIAHVCEILGREEEEKWYNHFFGLKKKKSIKQYRKAVECMEKALALQKELGVSDTIHTAIFQRNLANILIGLREYDQALEHAHKSFEIRIANLGKHPDTARILYLIGIIHEWREDPEEALRSYAVAFVMEESLPEDNHSVVRKLLCDRLEEMCNRVNEKDKLEKYGPRMTKMRKFYEMCKTYKQKEDVTISDEPVRMFPSSVGHQGEEDDVACSEILINVSVKKLKTILPAPGRLEDEEPVCISYTVFKKVVTSNRTIKMILMSNGCNEEAVSEVELKGYTKETSSKTDVHVEKEAILKLKAGIHIGDHCAVNLEREWKIKKEQLWKTEKLCEDLGRNAFELPLSFHSDGSDGPVLLFGGKISINMLKGLGCDGRSTDPSCSTNYTLANPPLYSSEHEEEDDEEIQDLVSRFGEASLATLSAGEVAERLPQYLGVDRTLIPDPPPEIMQKCQQFCRLLKNNGRKDIVKALREALPSGMTGPLLDGNILVKDLDHATKLKLSRALSVKDEWQIFAEKIDDITHIDIQFYSAKKDNPVLEILNAHCANMKIDTLYRILVESGANAFADFL